MSFLTLCDQGMVYLSRLWFSHQTHHQHSTSILSTYICMELDMCTYIYMYIYICIAKAP